MASSAPAQYFYENAGHELWKTIIGDIMQRMKPELLTRIDEILTRYHLHEDAYYTAFLAKHLPQVHAHRELLRPRLPKPSRKTMPTQCVEHSTYGSTEPNPNPHASNKRGRTGGRRGHAIKRSRTG